MQRDVAAVVDVCPVEFAVYEQGLKRFISYAACNGCHGRNELRAMRPTGCAHAPRDGPAQHGLVSGKRGAQLG